eukprot:855124-Rhodomonas_salina.1
MRWLTARREKVVDDDHAVVGSERPEPEDSTAVRMTAKDRQCQTRNGKALVKIDARVGKKKITEDTSCRRGPQHTL